MNIDSCFADKISYMNIEALSKSNDVIYIVDDNLRFRAYNNAWEKFAENNNGKSLLEGFSFGFKVTDVGDGPIQKHISMCYKNALRNNTTFKQDYECSSPDTKRIFHQTAYPLIESRGLVISHHLLVEKDHSEEITEFSDRFRNEHGIVTQCANCRKVKEPKSDMWVWIPMLVETPILKISHGICIPCLNHYYPTISKAVKL